MKRIFLQEVLKHNDRTQSGLKYLQCPSGEKKMDPVSELTTTQPICSPYGPFIMDQNWIKAGVRLDRQHKAGHKQMERREDGTSEDLW
nr:uncharacterized protein LOC129164323 [Nothobranchius furzeri]